jgi:hypothetical protein
VTPTPTVMYAASLSVLPGSKSTVLTLLRYQRMAWGLRRFRRFRGCPGHRAPASTLATITQVINSCKRS